jgi:ribosomal protein L1
MTTPAMRERDFRLMQRNTATPLESGRVTALADRCEAEGLDNCAATLRGLLAEVARLTASMTRLRDCDWTITPADRMDAVRDIARAALNGEDTRPHD